MKCVHITVGDEIHYSFIAIGQLCRLKLKQVYVLRNSKNLVDEGEAFVNQHADKTQKHIEAHK